MTYKTTTNIEIPAGVPRAHLVVRIINGTPLLFTDDGRFIASQCDLTVKAPLDGVLACTADFLLPAIQNGLP